MRIGLLTEGARPYATGEPWLWRGRLVRGLTQRAFAFTVPSHPAHRRAGAGPPCRAGSTGCAPRRSGTGAAVDATRSPARRPPFRGRWPNASSGRL
ncbi:hypothetical protein ID875_15645 [Streptomyces globisporus]|uniref:Transferase n=1 Tax=Streptomyces globisporus TaxID=1908 RepID=A0A927GND7_STRGL|nr:hypothetical protein [Streptomyces globisporus]